MPIPVTLDDAKRQLRMDVDDVSRDDEIQTFIDDAAAWIEEYTGHVLQERDATAEFSSFEDIRFREWPIAPSAVPVVTFQATGGNVVPVSDVEIRVAGRSVRFYRSGGARWPQLPNGNTVTVTLRVGYRATAAVPAIFRRVMLMLIAAYDDDREGGDIITKAEATARRLCSGKRPRPV